MLTDLKMTSRRERVYRERPLRVTAEEAAETPVALKVMAALRVAEGVSGQQILDVFDGYTTSATTYLNGLVSSAPVSARASLVELTWEEEADQRSRVQPQWWYYPKPSLRLDVSMGTKQADVFAGFEPYFEWAKSEIRALVATAPVGMQLVIEGWHMHPYDDQGVMSEAQEGEPT